MGIATPSSMPPACPDCCGDLPAILHGSADHPVHGFFEFDFEQDPIDDCLFEYIPPGPPIHPWTWVALFCEVGDSLTLAETFGMVECNLPGNHCNMPAQCTIDGSWTIRIWE